MAAKKKTAKATDTEVTTATETTTTETAPAKKATAKKKKVAAKKTAAKKATTANTVTKAKESTETTTTADQTASSKVAAKKVVAKKAPAKKAAARKSASDGQFKTFEPYKVAKGEEYMSPEQTEHFRTILTDWKVSLMQEVDRTVGHMKSDATNFPDPNDRATQEEEFSLELRTRDRERKLIKKIDESMTKLDEDEYGYCDGCGVEIGIRRLEARPTANMCIECKTLEEIREKQIA